MEDTLKRLLDAELQAQALVDKAFTERDRLLQQAQQEVKVAEQRFEKRVPEIHASFLSKAEQRAEQETAELQRRLQEKQLELERMARQRMDDAVQAALALLVGSDRT